MTLLIRSSLGWGIESGGRGWSAADGRRLAVVGAFARRALSGGLGCGASVAPAARSRRGCTGRGQRCCSGAVLFVPMLLGGQVAGGAATAVPS